MKLVAGAAFESAVQGYEPRELPHTLPGNKLVETFLQSSPRSPVSPGPWYRLDGRLRYAQIGCRAEELHSVRATVMSRAWSNLPA